MQLPRVFGLVAATLFVPSTGATPVPAQDAAAAVLPPSQDPWYKPPADFETAAPGAVLRVRAEPTNLAGTIANCSAAYNVLYRSSDAVGRPSWAVTTLLVPAAPVAPGPLLVSYQIPYNTADVDASPSATLHLYTGDIDGLPNLRPDLGAILSLGLFLSIPDFEGPYAALGSGTRAGYAVLDAVRAVLALEAVPGSAATARAAIGGYSGGSFASVFAAELQATYTPELAIAAVAVGGLVANTKQTLLASNGTETAFLVPSGLLGITAEFPAARAALLRLLRPDGPRNATGFLAAAHGRIDELGHRYAFQNMGDYFIGGLDAPFEDCHIVRLIQEYGQMGHHSTPRMPLFVYHAIGDELTSIEATDRLVDQYCADGANILYQRNTVGDHNSEAVNGMPRSIAFAMQAFAGQLGSTFPAQGCRVENVTVDHHSAAS